MSLCQFFAVDVDTGVKLPYATVSVYQTGTNNLVTPLFEIDGATAKLNPFQCTAVGLVQFQCADQVVDIAISLGGKNQPMVAQYDLLKASDLKKNLASVAEGSGADAIPNVPKTVSNLAELQRLTGGTTGSLIKVLGYATAVSTVPDKTAGDFVVGPANDATPAVPGVIVVSADGRRRYRLFNGAVYLEWSQADTTGAVNATAKIEALLAWARPLGLSVASGPATYLVDYVRFSYNGQNVLSFKGDSDSLTVFRWSGAANTGTTSVPVVQYANCAASCAQDFKVLGKSPSNTYAAGLLDRSFPSVGPSVNGNDSRITLDGFTAWGYNGTNDNDSIIEHVRTVNAVTSAGASASTLPGIIANGAGGTMILKQCETTDSCAQIAAQNIVIDGGYYRGLVAVGSSFNLLGLINAQIYNNPTTGICIDCGTYGLSVNAINSILVKSGSGTTYAFSGFVSAYNEFTNCVIGTDQMFGPATTTNGNRSLTKLKGGSITAIENATALLQVKHEMAQTTTGNVMDYEGYSAARGSLSVGTQIAAGQFNDLVASASLQADLAYQLTVKINSPNNFGVGTTASFYCSAFNNGGTALAIPSMGSEDTDHSGRTISLRHSGAGNPASIQYALSVAIPAGATVTWKLRVIEDLTR